MVVSELSARRIARALGLRLDLGIEAPRCGRASLLLATEGEVQARSDGGREPLARRELLARLGGLAPVEQVAAVAKELLGDRGLLLRNRGTSRELGEKHGGGGGGSGARHRGRQFR